MCIITHRSLQPHAMVLTPKEEQRASIRRLEAHTWRPECQPSPQDTEPRYLLLFVERSHNNKFLPESKCQDFRIPPPQPTTEDFHIQICFISNGREYLELTTLKILGLD